MKFMKPALVLLLLSALTACVSWSARVDRAASLQLGQPYYTQLATGSRLYRFELEAPATVSLEAITPPSRTKPGGFSARLLGDEGSVIAEDRRSGRGENFRIEQPLQAGIYYLEVRPDFACSSLACEGENMSFELRSRLRRD